MNAARLAIACLQVYSLLILARAVTSWVNPDPRNELLLWMIRLTEPVLAPIRRLLPLPGVDLSPVLACLLIQVLMRWIAQAGA